eukprot:SAG31_NODE_37870_length_300_cov_1.537313_1_plen_89_part_10
MVRVVTFSFLCPLSEKYGTFIARCNALIEKVSSFRRMWKEDYQCYACPPTPAGGVPCQSAGRWSTCPKCDPKSSTFNNTECYAKSEWRH